MEEPDSGFHAVGVLTRSPAWEYGWKFNYLTENTSGAEKSEVKEKIPPKPLTALEHLERCGYRIVQQVVPKKTSADCHSADGMENRRSSLRPGSGGFLAVYSDTYAE